MIGTPQFSSSSTLLNQGAVTMFYGATTGSAAQLTGTIPLSNIPTGIQSVTLTGANAGDLAGYAVSPVGFINVGQPNPILIGAPGFSTDSGTAYLIPGRSWIHGDLLAVQCRVGPDLRSAVRPHDAGLALDLAQFLRGVGVEPIPGLDFHRRW